MATYTVYVPLSGGANRRADRTVFVREGFSLAAFVFGPFYLISQRLWLAAFGWIVAAVLLAGLGHALVLSPPQVAVLFGLLGLLTGLEASVLRQFGLARRGYILSALLTAPRPEQAERGYFNGEGTRDMSWRLAGQATRAGQSQLVQSSEIIGLFPQAGDA